MNEIELVAVCAIIETALIFYLSDIDKEPKNPSPRGPGRGAAGLWPGSEGAELRQKFMMDTFCRFLKKC